MSKRVFRPTLCLNRTTNSYFKIVFRLLGDRENSTKIDKGK